jgi:tRNA pseudouridine55 synthase
MQTFDAFDGALLVDKPSGLTSHDVVDLIRKHFEIRKAGHCGTLDPNATGLLILVMGRATRLAEKLMSADKVYEGAIKFGESTNTYDVDGEVVAVSPVPPLDVDRLNQEAEAFVGDLMQTPPMTSAAKVDGVPLYKLARKGVEIERKPRLVHIYSLRFLACEGPVASFRIACTKGTYVRSIAHELGQKLGCGAHLRSLRRVEIGRFSVRDALPLDQILALPQAEALARVIPLLKISAME